jgi:protein-disulfide isomerase
MNNATTGSEPLSWMRKMADLAQVCFAIGIVICLFGFIWTRQIHSAELNRTSAPTLVTGVKPLQIIGANPCWYGKTGAAYTLVEFADYQCPPCGVAAQRIPTVLDSLHDKVRFTFRNYPLKDMHPQAYPAAVAAEIARRHGAFWELHDALYAHQKQLTSSYLSKTLKAIGISVTPNSQDQRMAEQVIAQDISDGDLCGVKGTPAFILCCPDGRILRFTAIDQMLSIVK